MITMFNVLHDQKLWMALTFPVPLILIDLTTNFTWKINQFWLIFNRKFYCSVLKYCTSPYLELCLGKLGIFMVILL